MENFKLYLVFCFCLVAVFGQGDDLCLPLRRGVLGDDPGHPGPIIQQGRPGKIGPAGVAGPLGLKGDKGSPGRCECDPNEIDQLREEIRPLKECLRLSSSQARVYVCGVGIRDGRIPDSAFSASSMWDDDYAAHYARLDNAGGGPRGIWHVGQGQNMPGQWVQVDLQKQTQVVGVVTQGRPSTNQWITRYKISYGNLPNVLQMITNESGHKIFQGNTDRNSHVINMFPQPITARHFRLTVVEVHVYAVLRMEYLVC